MTIRDRVLRMPRWLDATWAILAVAGCVLSYIYETGPLYWWYASSMFAMMLRFQLTAWRINRGVSALCDPLDRGLDWWRARQDRKRS